jgi:dTDP-4-amino-4,6-dideoxygalactose transaminase
MGIAFDIQEYWDLSDAQAALEATLSSHGDAIAEFEKAFASFTGGLDAVFLISGREALYQALKLIGVGAGDQVILSAFNCARVPDAVLRCGAVPVLVDVELPGGEMDLDLVKQVLSPKVRAVVIPHLYGIPVDFRAIKSELERHGVVIIEDCAHCLGGTIGGQVPGSLGAFSIFSFNTGKPITLGNGGMLVCSDADWLDAFRHQKTRLRQDYSTDAHEEFEDIKKILDSLASLRSQTRQGRSPKNLTIPKWRLLRHPIGLTGLWLYNRLRPAAPLTFPFNDEFSRVGAVRAHLGLSLLRQWPEILALRNRNAEYLRSRIQEGPWGETCTVPADIQPAYYKLNLFADELTARQVECVIARLRLSGFWAGRWPFINHVPRLVGRLRRGSRLPNIHRMAAHGLHLPIHQNMIRQDLDRMLDILWSAKP